MEASEATIKCIGADSPNRPGLFNALEICVRGNGGLNNGRGGWKMHEIQTMNKAVCPFGANHYYIPNENKGYGPKDGDMLASNPTQSAAHHELLVGPSSL